jgi:diguanylate cyclase (GGDEF)-like protein/PAS domain S-box-containing protein
MNSQSIIKRFLIIFLPLAIALGVITFAIYTSKTSADRAVLTSHEKHYIDIQKQRITNSFSGVVSDLMVISMHNDLHKMFETEKGKHLQALAEEFLAFSRYKRAYDQVRFIDDEGMEVVRINFNYGNPAIVAPEGLQNKAKRYYFRDTFALKRGEAFFSPLDLNIEGGKIEEPLKPMIRVGTPVFDDSGRKRGIVLLNYFGRYLLDDPLAEAEKDSGLLMLLNRDGYWLKGSKPEDEWGFMYPEKWDVTFLRRFPKAAGEIFGSEAGQLINSEGMFTFATIYPIGEKLKTSNGSGKAFGPSAGLLKPTDYYWKLVSFVSPETLSAGSRSYLKRLLAADAALLAILALGTWLLARTQVLQKQAEKKLLESEQRYRLITRTANDAIITSDADGKIISWNKGAEAIFGYTEGEIIGRPVSTLMPERYKEAHNNGIERARSGAESNIIGTSSEFHGLRKDGEEFPLDLSLASWKENGSTFYSGIIRDTTERVEMERKLERLATTDKLTGAYNRARFDEIILLEMERARRFKHPLSIIIFDLDNFKYINDTFGHQAGDHALRSIADIALTQMRKINHLVRWGGDEFVVITPETDAGGAEAVSERLRRVIEGHEFDKKWKITATFGVAQYKPDETEDSFLKRADDALFRAKAAGGNRIMSSE